MANTNNNMAETEVPASPEMGSKYAKSRFVGISAFIVSILYPLAFFTDSAQMFLDFAPTFYTFTGTMTTAWMINANGREAIEHRSKLQFGK